MARTMATNPRRRRACSYGEAVISNAAAGNDQVKALVYINGWVPDEGESLLQLAQLNEGSLIQNALRPLPYASTDGSAVVDLYLAQDLFREAFAGDVDLQTAEVMAVAQRPFTEAAFAAPSGPIAWKSVPSWYLLGTEDKAIPPATQRFMAERAGRRSRRSPPPTRRWSRNPAPRLNSFSPQSARSEKRPPKLPVDGSI
jgi:pimeloyl-ACP methyl ester carboxylesterase